MPMIKKQQQENGSTMDYWGKTTRRNSGTMEDQSAPITADHCDINGAE